jgi:thiosulfate dehydrogenase [quinone] large subunit
MAGPAAGTIIGPVTTWFAANAPWFANFMIPWGELLIGLVVMVGALTRLAAFFGSFLMFFFYFGNADWEHGFVNGDLMGLLLFLTIIVFAAGRIWGIDAYLEETSTVTERPWLRYVLA